jgi:hypothetical protein
VNPNERDNIALLLVLAGRRSQPLSATTSVAVSRELIGDHSRADRDVFGLHIAVALQRETHLT